MTTTKKYSAKSADERDAAVKAALARVTEAVANIKSSDEWKAYLKVASRFHRYSFNNVILMTLQAADRGMAPLSHIAGFKTWLTMDRCVRKGEKGLQIFAPVIAKREETDKQTGVTAEVRKLVGFRLTSVFDYQQTDGEPLPAAPVFDQPKGKAPSGLIDALIAHAGRLGYTVSFGKTGHAEGYTQPLTHQIVISEGLPNDAARASVLAHELAHATLHADADYDYTAHRGTAETEAEGVAFVVAEFYGLEVGNSSAGYIAGWAPDTETLMKVGQRITSTAKAIIDGTVEAVTE